MSLPAYEKLGAFYLGRDYDPRTDALGEDLLYDSRDLTTHAVCIGMTGSGKTGLCLSLLEEAALDGIPAIAIDPKGDIANLLLAFPELRPDDFAPWIDAGEAARKGLEPAAYAAQTAEQWRKGLADWGQDGARIARLKAAADVAIYTPGSEAGRPLSILRSFAAPDAAALADSSAMKERIGAAVGGLLGLVGVAADPILSREHQLLSAILDEAWRGGQSPDLAGLIAAVQKPPFDKVGVFDLETFYPAKERTQLALRINGLLASPGFAAWLHGEPIDAGKLLYTAEGKPRIAIISIAHLNDAERMFVVTLVANEMLSWMRKQSGTTSLRAIFYMDEVFGYFPPTAMPPSKTPLLTLMKQARAFGLGMVLATQNPVDLDYKGLSNAGTWFIGRLQTERDKARVIEGLLGSEAAAGLDRAALEALMANLAQRTFLMRNVHDDAPRLFRTRWALSYLRGPLTLAEIARLSPPRSAPSAPSAPSANRPLASDPTATATAAPASARPNVSAGVVERYAEPPADGAAWRPWLGARVRAHFVERKAGMDAWEHWHYLVPFGTDEPDWAAARVHNQSELALTATPPVAARYAEPPATALVERSYRGWQKQLADHVYRHATLAVHHCAQLGEYAAPGGDEAAFRAHLAQRLREQRDAAVDQLRRKFDAKIARAEEQLRKAAQRVEREQAQARSATTSSALSVGGSLLGALFGGGRSGSALRRAGSAVRNAGRIGKERADVEHAEQNLAVEQAEVEQLRAELDAEVEKLVAAHDPNNLRVETVTIRPRKTDVEVEDLALVWSA
jgi:hypothetical protein